jgi:hypothetical protein
LYAAWFRVKREPAVEDVAVRDVAIA